MGAAIHTFSTQPLAGLAGWCLALLFWGSGCSSDPAASDRPGPGTATETETEATEGMALTVTHNCGAGKELYVTVNSGDTFSGGGVTCAGGATCKISAGTYTVPLNSAGYDFHIGESPNNATKAEFTYLTQASYDISVITDGSQCPNSCKDSSCCQQHFNESVKIYSASGDCRCLYCGDVNCADAFHYPTNNSKQVNCPTATELTIEFCPAAACPPPPFATCTQAQLSVCQGPPGTGPCTGNQQYCCPQPSYGASHACYCAKASASCATALDAGSGCKAAPSNYCYVPN